MPKSPTHDKFLDSLEKRIKKTGKTWKKLVKRMGRADGMIQGAPFQEFNQAQRERFNGLLVEAAKIGSEVAASKIRYSKNEKESKSSTKGRK